VTVRKLIPLAVAFGLWAAGPAPAQDKAETAAAKAANQKLADAVAEKLKAAGVAKGAKLDIETHGGALKLSGVATSEQQHEEILETLKKVPGLRRIESYVTVPGSAGRVQRAGGQVEGGVGPVPGPGSPYSVAAAPPPGAPGFVPGPGPFAAGDPVPLNGMPAMAPVDPAGPRLPPYAWPTYAPYNNYSRVAYPQTYPYNAFPYIGPYYPFPRVPLGWRKVQLEWEDGHWYYGKLSSPHDFWRVKFW
jgi:BON domain